tara:strand:- start:45 stop:251 length:207 start_codon:yes stop_codon:yes gene_type:complete
MTREEKWELFVCFLELNDALEIYEANARAGTKRRLPPYDWVNAFGWYGVGKRDWSVLYKEWKRLERAL